MLSFFEFVLKNCSSIFAFPFYILKTCILLLETLFQTSMAMNNALQIINKYIRYLKWHNIYINLSFSMYA